MKGSQIKLVITDFDGTLVDTYKANLLSYQKAFNELGLSLSSDEYSRCFGFRFEEFMNEIGVIDNDVRTQIKLLKAKYYPLHFEYLILNESLLKFLISFKKMGGKIALASTAKIENLKKVLEFYDILQYFDLILSGESVKLGKPSPEIYLSILDYFKIRPKDALIFEDTEIGAIAAQNAGINYILINSLFYGN